MAKAREAIQTAATAVEKEDGMASGESTVGAGVGGGGTGGAGTGEGTSKVTGGESAAHPGKPSKEAIARIAAAQQGMTPLPVGQQARLPAQQGMTPLPVGQQARLPAQQGMTPLGQQGRSATPPRSMGGAAKPALHGVQLPIASRPTKPK